MDINSGRSSRIKEHAGSRQHSWLIRLKQSFANHKTGWFILACLGGILMFWILFLFGRGTEPTYPIKRIIQYGFDVENRSGKVVRNVEFWTYAPVKQTSTQKLEKLTVSHPYDLIEDKLGNRIIHLKFDYIPPFATKIVTVQADLLLSDRPNSRPLKNREDFLRGEKFIETEHAEIKKAASSFSGVGESNVESIYQWTADHIQGVAYVREDRGALYALRKKSGDCTEYAYLFTALCRVKGIPARPLGGYVLSESGTLSAASYHNWSEFYLNGAWHVADPQMKVFMDRPSRFIAMNIISGSVNNPMNGAHRFRFTGKDIVVTMR